MILEIPLTPSPRNVSQSPMKLEDAASRLEALGNPTRLRIYRVLVKAGNTGLPVGKLQSRLGVPASTLSHHLKTLLIVGLITQDRDATTLYCKANYTVMRGLVGFLVDECCTEADCASIRQQADTAV